MPPDDDPQLRYTDRKSHFTNVALERAHSGDHPSWDPDQLFAPNRPQIVDAYGYYRDLYLDQPDLFLWAGLGRMAGGAVVGGIDADPGFSEQSILVRIGRDIFFDLAWMHEAFLASEPVVELAGLHDQFNAYPRYHDDRSVTY